MYIRKKNNENARIKRPAKRIKSYDVFFTSGYGLYLKPMAIFSALITLDFLMEIRVEYLWSCWFLIKSASESYKYQGLIFSLFFVLIVLTSDIICYLLIPVTWLFFIASTYVWVQLVGQTERGICLPTIAISLLFFYLEYLLRFRTFNQFAFSVGICKPFAAHGIGYPVVTMGFGLKTYVSYRFRIRKKRDVEAVNRFHFQLIDQALPDTNRRYRIEATEDHESSSIGSDSIENSSIEPCQNNPNQNSVSQNCKNDNISHKLSKSSNIPNGKLDHNNHNHNHNYQNHHFSHSSSNKSKKMVPLKTINENRRSSFVPSKKDVLNSKNNTGGSLDYVKQWALTNSQNNHSATNTKHPPNGHVGKHGHGGNHNKNHNNHHQSQQQIISSNNPTANLCNDAGGSSTNTGPNLSSSISLQHGNVNSSRSSMVSSASSVSSTSSKSSHVSQQKKLSADPGSESTSLSISTTSSSSTATIQANTTGDMKHHHPAGENKAGNTNKKNAKMTHKDDATNMKIEQDLKKLRGEVQHARAHEQELKSQISTLNQSYQTTKRELSQSRNDTTQAQHKLDSLHKKLNSEKQSAQQLEKKLTEEKKNVQLLEQQLTNEKKARKEECDIKNKALQSATIAAAKPTDCTESCKLKRRQMESELKTLKKERQNLDDQMKQLELQALELPKLRKLADELRNMTINFNNLLEEKEHLVRTLSDENKIKQNLITAYHSSLKEVNALNEQLTEKDYQILQLNVNSAMKTQHNLPSSTSSLSSTINSPVSIDHHNQQHLNQHQQMNPYHSQYHHNPHHQYHHHQPQQSYHQHKIHHPHQLMHHRNTPTSPVIMDQQHITSSSASLYHHNIVSSPNTINNNIFFGDMTTSTSSSPPSSISNGILGSNNKLNISSSNNISGNNSSHMIYGNGLYSNSNLSQTNITSTNNLIFRTNDTNNNNTTTNIATSNTDVLTNSNHTGNNNNKSKNVQLGSSTTNNNTQVSSW